MKHVVFVASVVALPLVAGAAFETVVQPSYQEEVFVSEGEGTQAGINSALTAGNEPVQERTGGTGSMQITTEIGTTTVSTGSAPTSSNESDEVDLNEFVDELNEEYVEAEASCTTGSWLANIWCKVRWW